MVFNSFVFAVFFVIVYVLYISTMRRRVIQNVMLLAASYLFYGWWDWRFLGLVFLTTFLDYGAALAIDRRRFRGNDFEPSTRPYHHSPRARRVILAISIAANLGVLGFFKYFDFFEESASAALTALGFSVHMSTLRVILPVGISFYTFQSMSYTIDVYRGTLRAARNPVDFALFVAFFPQLVAGPIVRAADLLPQVMRPRRLNLEQTYEGAHLIFWGLFKKVVIADNLSPLVDRVFTASETPAGGVVLVAVYAFAVQVYCDFSGYSDIARGCAKTMGFEFDLNFDLPYFATNPSEFWRRWHISLSTWLRDYLYVPLGGNRKGPGRTYLHLMVTMVLGGLWHGAAWTFVLWGVYQGALLIGYRAAAGWFGPQRAIDRFASSAPGRIAAGLIFFHFICAGWLIFRAGSVSQAMTFFWAIFSAWSPIRATSVVQASDLVMLAAYTFPLFALELAQYRKADLMVLLRTPSWMRGVGYACLFYGFVLFGGRVHKPFIYFQF